MERPSSRVVLPALVGVFVVEQLDGRDEAGEQTFAVARPVGMFRLDRRASTGLIGCPVTMNVPLRQ